MSRNGEPLVFPQPEGAPKAVRAHGPLLVVPGFIRRYERIQKMTETEPRYIAAANMSARSRIGYEGVLARRANEYANAHEELSSGPGVSAVVFENATVTAGRTDSKSGLYFASGRSKSPRTRGIIPVSEAVNAKLHPKIYIADADEVTSLTSLVISFDLPKLVIHSGNTDFVTQANKYFDHPYPSLLIVGNQALSAFYTAMSEKTDSEVSIRTQRRLGMLSQAAGLLTEYGFEMDSQIIEQQKVI